jgi:hypothetical protein
MIQFMQVKKFDDIVDFEEFLHTECCQYYSLASTRL